MYYVMDKAGRFLCLNNRRSYSHYEAMFFDTVEEARKYLTYDFTKVIKI